MSLGHADDSDDGVMPLTYTDSDWERLSCDGDSLPPALLEPNQPISLATARSRQYQAADTEDDFDEEDIAPCDDDPEENIGDLSDTEQLETTKCISTYAEDEPTENIDLTRSDAYDSGVTGSMSERVHAQGSREAPLKRFTDCKQVCTSFSLELISLIENLAQTRLQWFFKSSFYNRYLADNATLCSALLTATIIITLPLAATLVAAAACVVCLAVICALIIATALALGVALSIVWSLWVAVPVAIIIGSLFIGSRLYQWAFTMKLSAKKCV